MRISDWSSDVCSSDLYRGAARRRAARTGDLRSRAGQSAGAADAVGHGRFGARRNATREPALSDAGPRLERRLRSEEHTSELQSLMRISYAVFCLKKKNNV